MRAGGFDTNRRRERRSVNHMKEVQKALADAETWFIESPLRIKLVPFFQHRDELPDTFGTAFRAFWRCECGTGWRSDWHAVERGEKGFGLRMHVQFRL